MVDFVLGIGGFVVHDAEAPGDGSGATLPVTCSVAAECAGRADGLQRSGHTEGMLGLGTSPPGAAISASGREAW